MFIFIPKTKDHDEFFLTDSIILYLIYTLLGKKVRMKK